MLKRTVTGLVCAVLLLAVLYARGPVFDIVVSLVSLLSCYEMFKAFKAAGFSPVSWPIYAMAVLLLPMYLLLSFVGVYLLFVFAIMAVMLVMMFREKPSWRDAAASLNVQISVLLPLSLLYPLIRIKPELLGALLTFLVFLIALLGDTFAYFFGVLLGRHKMAPAISPNKTWEGLVAGLLGSIAGATAFCYAANFFTPMPPLWHFALLGLVGGVMGVLGDLSASLVKRFCGIKDFGSVFPGHGGMLDRLDSIIFVIYVVFGYCLMMGWV